VSPRQITLAECFVLLMIVMALVVVAGS